MLSKRRSIGEPLSWPCCYSPCTSGCEPHSWSATGILKYVSWLPGCCLLWIQALWNLHAGHVVASSTDSTDIMHWPPKLLSPQVYGCGNAALD